MKHTVHETLSLSVYTINQCAGVSIILTGEISCVVNNIFSLFILHLSSKTVCPLVCMLRHLYTVFEQFIDAVFNLHTINLM